MRPNLLFALRRLGPAAACLIASQVFAAAPIGVNDAYSVGEDGVLTVASAQGVLLNDDNNGNAIVEAALVTGALHGSLTLNADGSFSYTPSANYNGTDTFTYKVRKQVLPPLFTITQATSNVTMTGKIYTPVGNQTKSDTSAMTGTINMVLDPKTAGPFSQAQIVNMSATLTDDITLNYNLLFGAFKADLHALPNSLSMSMTQPGAAAPVNGVGQFTQTGNILSVAGTVDVSYSGVGITPSSGSQNLNTTATVDFTNATITSNGTTLSLVLPVNYAQNGVVVNADPVVTADISIVGTIRATAPAINNVAEESAAVTVTITVDPSNDPPVATADSYVTMQATPLNIPAAAAPTTQTIFPEASTWKYRYDGLNIGTAWREVAYNDGAWASGSGILGFGDPDIVTNIRPGATPNHTTAYFRKEFTINGLANTRPGVKVFLKRDDGAAVYLNGTRIYLDSNLPDPPAFDTYTTANRPDVEENTFVEIAVSRTLLFEGKNVLAVEVHQASAASSDLRFDAYITREIGAAGVLSNDSDIDNLASSLVATVVEPPAHGTVVLQPNGSFIYTPAGSFSGDDSFLYKLDDGGGNAAVATVISAGSTWSYLADGTNQGTAWRAAAFDDSAWPTGPAELGYGDTGEGRPEATKIRADGVTTVYPTYYFRKKFTLPTDKSFVTSVLGEILRDDGAAVYVNGTEVFRDTYLAANAPFSAYTTGGASTPSETDFTEFTIPASVLVNGENVIAVEVHQASASSSDVSFDLKMSAAIGAGARASIHVNSDDLDGDGVSDTWERQVGLSATSAADATADSDGDGASNRAEFLAGTNPFAAASVLAAGSATTTETTVTLVFKGVVIGKTYHVEASDDLKTWTPIATVNSTPGTASYTTTVARGSAPRYFRLECDTQWP